MEGLLLFAAVLAGAAWVALRPAWGAPCFAALIYLRLSDSLRAEFGFPSLFMFIAPGLLGLAVGRWLFTGEEVGRGWKTAVLLMVVYGAICTGSLIFAANTERTGEALMNYVDGVFIVLVMSLYLRRFVDFQRVTVALLLGGLLLGSLAVFQQLTGSFDATFAGLSRAELRNVYDETSGFRSEGPVSANYFALVLIVAVPFAVDRLVHGRDRWMRALSACTLGVVVAAVFYTYSRGGAVALLAASLPMLVWVPRRLRGRFVLATAAAGVVAILALAPTQYGQRLAALVQVADAVQGETPQDNALRGRISEMTSAALMFADHPLLGVGYGNFEDHYPRYARDLALDGRREERQAHSLYLEVAAETGLLGMLAFAFLLALPALGIRRTHEALVRAGREREAQQVMAFGIALFGYLVGSLFLHLSYPRYLWLLLGIAIGLSALRVGETAEQAASASSAPLEQAPA